MSGLLISGFVVGGFGLLVLIIGAILMATAKACTAADEACNSSKNRKKAGIGMVVMGCVLGVVGGVLLFLAYRKSISNGQDTTSSPPPLPERNTSLQSPRKVFKFAWGFEAPESKEQCKPECEKIPPGVLGDLTNRTSCVMNCNNLFP